MAALIGALVLCGFLRAEDGATPPNDELMRRIKELEATVRELKTRTPSAPPQAAQVPVTAAAPGAVPAGAVAPGAAPAAAEPIPDPIDPRAAPQFESAGMSGGGGGGGQGRPTRFEQERSGELQPVPPPGGLPPGQVAGWNNGFFIQSPDQSFVTRITGQIQTDSRWFPNGTDKTDVDEFILRRARLGLESIMFDFYEFRILAEYSGSNLNAPAPPSTPTPSIVDAYTNVHYVDYIQFLAGRFKQPISYEQLIIDRYTPFMERSLMDQLVPQRDVGVMVHGQNLLDSRVDYFLSVSNGQINGNFDNTNSKDVAGRLVVRPFAPNEGSFLRYLGVGVSGSFGDEHQALQVSASSSFPNVLRTPLGVPWLTFNAADFANGPRSRLCPELEYFWGPLAFSAQGYLQNQQISPTGLSGATAGAVTAGAVHQIPVTFHGYYVMSTLFLTGEERTGYSRGVTPLRPFDARCPFANYGAWELSARVSQLHVSDNIFAAGAANNLAAVAGNANGCTEMTLGFNWYLNQVALMRFNWEHDWFNRPVTLAPGPGGLLSKQDALGVRFEFAF